MLSAGQRFTVTDEHLKLLRRAYVGWDGCEYGAPAIDCKRPYGNSSVEEDMAEILGVEMVDGEYLRNADRERLRALHIETQTVLQIILATGILEPGDYVAPAYSVKWERVS